LLALLASPLRNVEAAPIVPPATTRAKMSVQRRRRTRKYERRSMATQP
jgi:hypothetical protein